ncbi:MAG: DUF6655 family protein [Planctomycetaceae bacterium]
MNFSSSPIYNVLTRQTQWLWLVMLTLLLTGSGCGTTKNISATEQLVASDAIDAAVGKIDLSPLAGQKVFFDDKYITDYKGIGFVNSNYIVSSMRQQITSAGCKLQEKVADADIVIEGRVGTLGSDSHDMVYGIPQNNGLSNAASLVPGSPTIPSIPELSLARKNELQGAAKVAMFAYDRESRQRIWQSGLSISRSSAKDSWVLGAGPFQRGTIYGEGVRFGGKQYMIPFAEDETAYRPGGFAALKQSALYAEGAEILSRGKSVEEGTEEADTSGVQQVKGEQSPSEEPRKIGTKAATNINTKQEAPKTNSSDVK